VTLSLGRLERAETVGPEWGLAWSFDGFGNRTQQSVVKGSGPVMSVAVNGLTNRVIGDSYDLNGNLTATAGGATYTWDAANRLTQFQSAQVTESYAYDPQNRRVWRRDGAGNEFVALYGIDGQLANEYGLGNHPSGGVCYWGPGLGNVRLGTQLLWKSTGVEVSDRLGSTAGAGSGFYPYGEAKAGTPASARYATYGRDTTGLHYALNRHYDPRQGRFLNPDPYEASAGASDPQSWNRYAYVQNDPVNRADPTGLLLCSAEFSHCQGFGPSLLMSTGGGLGGGWYGGPIIGGIFSISIWAFPWPTPAPAPAPEPEDSVDPECSLNVQYRPVSGTGQNHAYISYRVESGPVPAGFLERGVLEGQPQINPPVLVTVPMQPGGSIPHPPDWGNLEMTHNAAGRGNNPARDPRFGPQLWGPEVCDAIADMIAAVDRYNSRSPVKYNPLLGPNSNSAARYLLEAGGVASYFRRPPNVPGWDVQIPNAGIQ
jgi:RHS repeat-associated protein